MAICDSDVLGKKFEEKNLQLDLTSNFYKGEEKPEEEIKEIIKEVHILNIVGNKSIEFFRNLGLIQETIKIQGIEHAQVILSDDT